MNMMSFPFQILPQLETESTYRPRVCPHKLKSNPNVEVVPARSTIKSVRCGLNCFDKTVCLNRQRQIFGRETPWDESHRQAFCTGHAVRGEGMVVLPSSGNNT